MQDDLLIKAEGLDSLTDDELRTACKARGLKAAYGEGATMYMRKQMQVGRLAFSCWLACSCLHACQMTVNPTSNAQTDWRGKANKLVCSGCRC